jgi:glycosyltransferase involved in cell wall biosynthesis
MIEAMAAGLPVIASHLPAHADLIRDAKTGWLVDSRAALVEALREAETPSRARAVGLGAQAWVRTQIGTWDDCAARCIDAYRGLLAQGDGHAR